MNAALPSESRQLLLLTQRLSRLVDAVARLRQTQAEAAQAAAARAAAEQLRALHPGPIVPVPLAAVVSLRPVNVHGTARTPPRRGRLPPAEESCSVGGRPSAAVRATLAGGKDTRAEACRTGVRWGRVP